MPYAEFASVYDRLTDNVDYDEMGDRIVSILTNHGISSGLILDLACGTGSLLLKLFSKGMKYELIGVDASAEMLSEAYAKLFQSGYGTLLLCQSMEALDLYGTVAAAFCTLDSINHLDSLAKVKKTFARISLFIEPGGLFLFDVNTPYKHKEVLKDNTFVYDLGDIYCVWQNSTDENTLKTDISLDVFTEKKDGLFRRFSESFSECAYNDELLTVMLDDCGFDVIERYDGYTDKAPDEKTQRMLYVTMRRK